MQYRASAPPIRAAPAPHPAADWPGIVQAPPSNPPPRIVGGPSCAALRTAWSVNVHIERVVRLEYLQNNILILYNHYYTLVSLQFLQIKYHINMY